MLESVWLLLEDLVAIDNPGYANDEIITDEKISKTIKTIKMFRKFELFELFLFEEILLNCH